MTDQPSLFDDKDDDDDPLADFFPIEFDDLPREQRLDIAYELAAEGIAQVSGERSDAETKAARQAWIATAVEWVTDYCYDHELVFADDLWAEGLDHDGFDQRIMGPVMKRLAAAGTIVPAGESRRRTHGHGAPGQLWRSTLYRTKADA